jgi:hypothetical protein
MNLSYPFFIHNKLHPFLLDIYKIIYEVSLDIGPCENLWKFQWLNFNMLKYMQCNPLPFNVIDINLEYDFAT